MKGLSVLGRSDSITAFHFTYCTPPVTPGLRKHTDHRVQGELFQTVLILNVPKPPSPDIKIFLTGSCLPSLKVCFFYPKFILMVAWHPKVTSLLRATPQKLTTYCLASCSFFHPLQGSTPMTSRTLLCLLSPVLPHPPVPSLAPLPHGPASFI